MWQNRARNSARAGGFPAPGNLPGKAFSLLEMLVAMAVLVLLMGFLFTALSNSSRILRRSNEQMESFQEARTAFDSLSRSLRSATLNTYWGYDDVNDPDQYIRQSELQFVIRPGSTAGRGQDGIFFQSARSYNTDSGQARALTGLLNTCGFYVEFGPDAPPPGIPVKHRFRLKQMLLPGSQMTAYASTAFDDFGWFTNSWAQSVTLADNIILLRAWPKARDPLDPLAPESNSLSGDYSYNSRKDANANPQPVTANQMPPMIDLTIVAIDSSSAQRIDAGDSEPSQLTVALDGLFQTSTRAKYDEDLLKLEQRLTTAQPPIAYRVFRTTMPIEESKWSRQ